MKNHFTSASVALAMAFNPFEQYDSLVSLFEEWQLFVGHDTLASLPSSARKSAQNNLQNHS